MSGRAPLAIGLAVVVLGGASCGGAAPGGDAAARPATRVATRAGTDWTRFGFDAQRSNSGPARTGITARSVGRLRRRTVTLPGVADSSPIYLHAARVKGRRRDVFVVTTSYGRTLAIEARSGRRLWQFVPRGIARWQGTAQITNTTPVADPRRTAVYAASPDGRIHKLSLASGREVARGRWPVALTRDASKEKLAAALNISGGSVVATTGGYIGDAPPYQGKVVLISRASGRIVRVFNSLCADRRTIIVPSSCASSDSAIWARAGAVVVPGSRRLLVTTGNGPFDGRRDFGDSVIQLSRRANYLGSYTPADQKRLEDTDADLGSTAPALLPAPGGSLRRPRYALQAGKDGRIRLLSLAGLGRGARVGGELQVLRPPSGQLAFTTPAVSSRDGRTIVYTADFEGTAAYELRGRPARLTVLWQNGTAGTSPVQAGGLLWIYDPTRGGLNVYAPRSGRLIARLPAGPGHWNSPVIADGRVALPEGNANDRPRTAVLNIYSR